MNLTGIVKKYAIEDLDMDYVGIAGADRLSGAPAGYRPTDILPGAKSVIVMAVRLTQGAVQAIFRSYEDGFRHLQGIYGAHGYSLTPNYHLVFASYRMARLLEKKSHIAVPLPSGPGTGMMALSHRHAAIAAGLGELGQNGIFLTPDVGPRVRLVSVITKAELDPDPLYQGPKICVSPKCQVCIKVCPVQAISSTKNKKVIIGGQTFEYGDVDYIKCQYGAEGLLKKSHGLKDLLMPENPTLADLQISREQIDPRQRREAILPVDHPTFFCGKCLAYCPVGQDHNMMEHKPVN